MQGPGAHLHAEEEVRKTEVQPPDQMAQKKLLSLTFSYFYLTLFKMLVITINLVITPIIHSFFLTCYC
jgi:hypothetical protein